MSLMVEGGHRKRVVPQWGWYMCPRWPGHHIGKWFSRAAGKGMGRWIGWIAGGSPADPTAGKWRPKPWLSAIAWVFSHFVRLLICSGYCIM